MDYMTNQEAAEHLGRNPHSVRRYARAGKLTKYRRGDGSVLYDKAEIEALKAELNTIVKEG